MQKLRIGITTRIVNEIKYFEQRDALAHEWYAYFKNVLPNASWIMLPNIENDIIDYCNNWQLNSFIFSGGDNIGDYSKRDKNENLLFEYAQKKNLPVLGICRGAQALCLFAGGSIKKGNNNFSKTHKAKRHKIEFKNEITEVNSFHEYYIVEEVFPKAFNVLARCDTDNSIEAFTGNGILGVMWHPERENEFTQTYNKLITNFLYK